MKMSILIANFYYTENVNSDGQNLVLVEVESNHRFSLKENLTRIEMFGGG